MAPHHVEHGKEQQRRRQRPVVSLLLLAASVAFCLPTASAFMPVAVDPRRQQLLPRLQAIRGIEGFGGHFTLSPEVKTPAGGGASELVGRWPTDDATPRSKLIIQALTSVYLPPNQTNSAVPGHPRVLHGERGDDGRGAQAGALHRRHLHRWVGR